MFTSFLTNESFEQWLWLGWYKAVYPIRLITNEYDLHGDLSTTGYHQKPRNKVKLYLVYVFMS